jgi:transposase
MPGRLSTETRWAIVLEWKRKPQSLRAIAKVFNTSHNAVANIIKKYQETGGVDDLHRSGRPRKLKRGVVTNMLHRKKKSSTRRVARELQRAGGGKVSSTTVWRQAKEEKLVYRVRRKKPQLTKKMKEERIAFAQARYPPGFWKRVVASDEKCITLGGEVRGEWVKEGEKASPRPTHKFEPGVKFRAGSSWEGKTPLYFLPKSLKGWEYLNLIKSKLEPDILRLYPNKRRRPVWLQDREGFHIATAVHKYLAQSPLIPIKNWPSHSPDLNWQENVWERLEQRVRERKATTIKGLKKVVKEEWENVELASIRNCISSMPARLEAVVAARGGNTDY